MGKDIYISVSNIWFYYSRKLVKGQGQSTIAMWALSILIILVFFFGLYVTRFVIIVYTTNTNRGNVLNPIKRRKLPVKTMIVVGSGK